MLKRLLTSPYFNLFSFVCSLGIAAYFYVSSQSVSEITYSTDYNVVFDSTDNFPIYLNFEDKSIHGGSLLLVKYLFWNSGDTPLSLNDVRQNLAIRYEGVRFIDAKITHSDPEYSDFSSSIDASGVSFQWRFFDPGAFFETEFLVWTENKNIQLRPSVEIANFDGLYDHCDKPLLIIVFYVMLGFLIPLVITILLTSKMEDFEQSASSVMAFLVKYSTPIGFLIILPLVFFFSFGILFVSNALLFSEYSASGHPFMMIIDKPAAIEYLSCGQIKESS